MPAPPPFARGRLVRAAGAISLDEERPLGFQKRIFPLYLLERSLTEEEAKGDDDDKGEGEGEGEGDENAEVRFSLRCVWSKRSAGGPVGVGVWGTAERTFTLCAVRGLALRVRRAYAVGRVWAAVFSPGSGFLCCPRPPPPPPTHPARPPARLFLSSLLCPRRAKRTTRTAETIRTRLISGLCPLGAKIPPKKRTAFNRCQGSSGCSGYFKEDANCGNSTGAKSCCKAAGATLGGRLAVDWPWNATRQRHHAPKKRGRDACQLELVVVLVLVLGLWWVD